MVNSGFTAEFLRMVKDPGYRPRVRSASWDGGRHILRLRLELPRDGPEVVELHLSPGAVASIVDGRLDADVAALWGEGVGTVVGAARLMSVHLAELADTAKATYLACELTGSGIRPLSR